MSRSILITVLAIAFTTACGGQDIDNRETELRPKSPGEQPTLTCENVLCAGGHSCALNCEGKPVCNPDVCEGFAGFTCGDGFNCAKRKLAGADHGGVCKRDRCDDQPTLTCDNVLCPAGFACELNCDQVPVCNPVVCDDSAGPQCSEGYVCDAGFYPGQGGACVEVCN